MRGSDYVFFLFERIPLLTSDRVETTFFAILVLMSTDMSFSYEDAFSRNQGLITPEEQERIRHFTVAIPGMGGVGGAHLISCVRQGFEKFKIADFDTYELKNFNRQYGARLDTIGRSKVEVMREAALGINPQCSFETYTEITKENIDAFLHGVDLVIDSLDAFQIEARRLLFMEAHARKIPVITAGPIGFGTAFLIFMPGGPSFDRYFDIHDRMTTDAKLVAFFVGLVPSLLQRSYMRGTSIKERKGPSSIGSINLCAGVAGIYALKILLKKGKVRAVPYYHQYDVMQERYVCRKLRWGNRGLFQRLKIHLAQYLTHDETL